MLIVPEIKPQWVNEPPKVTANNWAIFDGDTGEVLFGENAKERKEIASLTKIMTLYTVLSLIKRFNLDPRQTEVTVSREASRIIGTRAELAEGDVFFAYDLLFAMMLPSGNDVAQCFAEHFGTLLHKESLKSAEGVATNLMIARKFFVFEMNTNGKAIGLAHTKFDNPSGLGDKFNKSTTEDVGKLCAAGMKMPEFREVVSCKEYKCTAKDKDGKPKACSWQNTHKLLSKGYNGIKTGITPNAGPCLASSKEVNGKLFIIVLLNSKSMEARWEETENLLAWCLQELELKKKNAV